MLAKENLAETLEPLLQAQLRGEEYPLEGYLVANSHLPGPAGNLPLMQAAAAALARAAEQEPERVWQLLARWGHLSVEAAPVNDPREMLPATAALGRGKVAVALPAYRQAALAALRGQARDQRWRTRELVAQGLQALLRADFAFTFDALFDWVVAGDPLEMRAAAAAVAEPDLAAAPGQAMEALRLHAAIMDRLMATSESDRRREAFRVLRQGLGYTLSVVIVGAPPEGFTALRAWTALPDADVRWILKENLKKARLSKAFPAEVAALTALLT